LTRAVSVRPAPPPTFVALTVARTASARSAADAPPTLAVMS
jgi:hypothetical protein